MKIKSKVLFFLSLLLFVLPAYAEQNQADTTVKQTDAELVKPQLVAEETVIEGPITLNYEQIVKRALENDLQQKIDVLNVKKLQILQYDAHKYKTDYKSTSENAGEVVSTYNRNFVKPAKADNEVKYAMRTELANRDKLKNDVENKAAQLYLLAEKVKRAEAEIAFAEKKQSIAELKLNLGMSIALDLEEARNAVENKKRDLKALIADKISADLELKSLIAMPFKQQLIVDYQVTEQTEYIIDPAIAEAQYLEYALDVVKAKDDFEVNKGLFDVVKEVYTPNLQEYKKAQLDLTKAERVYQEQKKNAKIAFQTEHEKLVIEYDRLKNARATLANAEQQYQNDQLKFNAGTISEIDKLHSENQMENARLELKIARNQYRQAVSNFKLLLKTYIIDISPRDYDSDDYYETEELPSERVQ